MATEVERKFLVKNDKWKKCVVLKRKIYQGYFTESARISINDAGKAKLNFKGPLKNKNERLELEYTVPEKDGWKLMKLKSWGNMIVKVRHELKIKGLENYHTTIDVFEKENKGLILLEIENNPGIKKAPNIKLLKEWIGEDVTHDSRYYNSQLAIIPYPL